MVAAAIERARKLKRELTDREIAASIVANEEHDAEVYAQWEATIADGLD